MTPRTKFIIAVALLFVVFLVAEYRLPRRFQWKPTFSHTDPQPFGCMVFDSILSTTMPHGYTVERRTLWQMEHDSVFTKPKAVMIITEEHDDNLIPKVLDLASRGNVIIVATTSLYLWTDTLGIDFNYNPSFKINDIAGKRAEKGILTWESDARQWPLYKQMIERTLFIPDSVNCKVLATFSKSPEVSEAPDDSEVSEVPDASEVPASPEAPLVVSFPLGNGELILISSPLLLTNYMMLSGDGHEFIARLMSHVAHLPVIRTESYTDGSSQAEQSPLYVLLREPPLRWAVYLTALTVLLLCIFTARRRQRAIPVITKPRNGNLEFTQLIGTLAWQQHNNAALLAQKLTYTAEELRRQTGIDVLGDLQSSSRPASLSVGHGSAVASATAPPASPPSPATVPAASPADLSQLAAHTGRDPEELRLLLKNIQHAASGLTPLSDEQLKTFIDELDNLIS